MHVLVSANGLEHNSVVDVVVVVVVLVPPAVFDQPWSAVCKEDIPMFVSKRKGMSLDKGIKKSSPA